LRLVEGRLNGGIERGRAAELSESDPQLPWTPLLPSRADAIAPLLVNRTAKLEDYCRVRRGIATGDNSFFAMTQAEVAEWEIEERFLVPAVLGARDLPMTGLLDEAFFQARLAKGARGLLFFCHEPLDALGGTRALRYIGMHIRLGMSASFRSKCVLFPTTW
jgi:hypothetical protein